MEFLAVSDDNLSPLDEYKTYIPKAQELATDIAAFANTRSGQIIIGNTSATSGQPTFSVFSNDQINAIKQSVNEALQFLNPKPNIRINIKDDSNENPRVIIFVEKNPNTILINDQYYIRKDNKTTIAEAELLEALSNVVPAIKPEIRNSLRAEVPSTNQSEDLGQLILRVLSDSAARTLAGDVINKLVQNSIAEKPKFELNEHIQKSIQSTSSNLTIQREERLKQARTTFIVALIVLVFAIILVFVGVILIYINKTQVGVVTSVTSIISSIVSGLAIVLNRQTNDRLDDYAKELVTLEQCYVTLEIISHIDDVKSRDEAIRDLAKSISVN